MRLAAGLCPDTRALPGHAAGAFDSAYPDPLAGFGGWGKGMIGREMDRGKR